jgi:hypothetical protein
VTDPRRMFVIRDGEQLFYVPLTESEAARLVKRLGTDNVVVASRDLKGDRQGREEVA